VSETASLFPVPAIPVASMPAVQMAATCARLAHRQLADALTRGGATEWTPEAVQEIGRLLAAAKAIHEGAEALLECSVRAFTAERNADLQRAAAKLGEASRDGKLPVIP